jgi:hypothetical protein
MYVMDAARTPEEIKRKQWWVAGKASWFTAPVKAQCGHITRAPTIAPTPMCPFVVISGLSEFAPKYNAMGEYQKESPMHYIRRVSYSLQFTLRKYKGIWKIGTGSFGGETGYDFLEVADTAESPTEITGDWFYHTTKNPKHFNPKLIIMCPTPAPTATPTLTPTPSPTLLPTVLVRQSPAGEYVKVIGVKKFQRSKMGVYKRLQKVSFLNGRPAYSRIGGGGFLFFFIGKGITTGSWYIGPKLGSSTVWLCVADKATDPTQITGRWELWNGVRWATEKSIKVVGGESVLLEWASNVQCCML